MTTTYYSFPLMPDTPPSGATGKTLRNMIIGETSDSLANMIDTELYRIDCNVDTMDYELTQFYSNIAGCVMQGLICSEVMLESQTLSPMEEGFRRVRFPSYGTWHEGGSAIAVEVWLKGKSKKLRIYVTSGDWIGQKNVYAKVFKGSGDVIYVVSLQDTVEVEIEGQTYTYPYGLYINTNLPNEEQIERVYVYYNPENLLKFQKDVNAQLETLGALPDQFQQLQEQVAETSTDVPRCILQTVLFTEDMAENPTLLNWTRVCDALPHRGYVRVETLSDTAQKEPDSLIGPFLPMTALGINGVYAALNGDLLIIPESIQLTAQQASIVLGTEVEEGITLPDGTWYNTERLEAILTENISSLVYSEDRAEYVEDPTFARIDFFPQAIDEPILWQYFLCSSQTQINGIFAADRIYLQSGKFKSSSDVGGRFVPLGELFPDFAALTGIYVLPSHYYMIAAMVATQQVMIPAGVLGEEAVTIPAGTYLLGDGTEAVTGLRRMVKVTDLINQ